MYFALMKYNHLLKVKCELISQLSRSIFLVRDLKREDALRHAKLLFFNDGLHPLCLLQAE